MASGMRVLVASPLGRVISTSMERDLDGVVVEVVGDRAGLVRSVTGKVRFDVVIADLIWNNPDAEWSFDGLDVINVLRDADRMAPVLLATQGHSMEQDHLDEARLRDEVSGIVRKSDGLEAIVAAIRAAAVGKRTDDAGPAPRAVPLYKEFVGQRGTTAGRLAGAIASGCTSDNASLAKAASVAPNTANKVTSHYLGPIMTRRGEHDTRLQLTQASVYRWCGLHARYLVSWCRRHGHEDVLKPV
ncbi:response regulator [Gordonia sp. NPDC062954]|uniref:response regulator n=1 Tax=Gordonia sp. NPDC062954 TaxID=3364003 RepID=UPI0037CAC1BA